MHPWKLAEMNYADAKSQAYEVAVLPFGCTEPHNLHLPYGTDTFESDVIGSRVCERAAANGARVLLLPTIPYGTTTNQRECPLSINVNPTTLFRFVQDIVESLTGHGVRKVLLLNSHGGNDLKPLLRELYGKTTARVFLCNWYQMVRDAYADIFENKDDHAGEMETSIALAYFPDLVARDDAGKLTADDGAIASSRFEAIERGWVSITRPWHLLTTNTGAGNPHAASAEKGRQVVDLIVSRLAPFLVELSNAELDEGFPF
ncbi:MAG: creatininase family protein [Phycisphaerae bacterium]